jgi:hypothetical protein
VDEFNAKLRTFFGKVRPTGFQDVDPTKEFDWNEIIQEPSRDKKT